MEVHNIPQEQAQEVINQYMSFAKDFDKPFKGVREIAN